MTVNIFHHGFTFVLTSPSVLSYFRTHHWIGFSFDFCNASTLVYLSTPWLAAIRKSYICRGMKRPLQQLKWIHSSEPPFYWTEYNMQCPPIPLDWVKYAMCMLATYFDRQVTVALIAVLHSPSPAVLLTDRPVHWLSKTSVTPSAYFGKSDWQSMAVAMQ